MAGLRRIPVEKWKYKDGVADGGEHVGPYAEDVQQQFGDGAAPGGKMIDLVSMNGIALSAIKGLDKRIASLERKTKSGGRTFDGNTGEEVDEEPNSRGPAVLPHAGLQRMEA